MATLAGKKVVIVGGSSGIGLGVAACALERGAEVVIVGRSASKLQAAQRALATADGRVRGLSADMTEETEIARLFNDVGAFDHLVSTAGAPPPGDPIDRTDMELVRRERRVTRMGRYTHVRSARRRGQAQPLRGHGSRLPVRKIATPADVAPAYIYAMESEFTTGQTIHIDGGQSLI